MPDLGNGACFFAQELDKTNCHVRERTAKAILCL